MSNPFDNLFVADPAALDTSAQKQKERQRKKMRRQLTVMQNQLKAEEDTDNRFLSKNKQVDFKPEIP
jgi:hypothetical protein